MLKSIFLHIHDDEGQDERLAVAIDLARAHQAQISCIRVTPFNSFVIGDPFGGLYASAELIGVLRERDETERGRIETRLQAEQVGWDWVQGDGDPARGLVSFGRLADLLVLSRERPQRDDAPPPLPIVADVAVHTRAPVLIVPPGMSRFDAGGPMVVAWNGSVEAAHALRLSVPMLRGASAVHVVSVAGEATDFPSSDAVRYLALHGIASELHERPRQGRNVADALAETALGFGASCLVMGAYGHSRFRETIIGGVTRHLLANATVPLLLAH